MLFSLSPFTRLLPGLENCWANFKTFSRIHNITHKKHMKLGIYMSQSCSDLSKQCTYQNLFAFLMFSMWWSSSLLKLPNYWKISVPFPFSRHISSLLIREVCPSKMINITVTNIRNLKCTTLTVLKTLFN